MVKMHTVGFVRKKVLKNTLFDEKGLKKWIKYDIILAVPCQVNLSYFFNHSDIFIFIKQTRWCKNSNNDSIKYYTFLEE